MTLYENILRSSRGYHGPALTFLNQTVNYDELKKHIKDLGQRLSHLGIKKDDVVCLCAPNIPQTVYAMYALDMIGAISFIVHPLFPVLGLKEELKRTKAKLLLVIDQRYSYYAKQIGEVPIYALSAQFDLPFLFRPFYRMIYAKELKGLKRGDFLENVPKKPLAEIAVNHDDAKPSFYLESGGTTGKSKIVVLNDYAVSFPGSQATWILEKTTKDVVGTTMIGLLPMFHGFGLAMGVNAPLANKAVSALMVSYDGKRITRLMEKGKLDYLICIPYMARKLLDNKHFKGRKLKNLDHAFIGADKPMQSLFREFDQRLEEAGSKCRLLEGYGLTETVTVITVNRLAARKVGSVGRPLKGVNLRIVDENGKVLPFGRPGQIEIDCPCMMLGYLDDPKATAEAFAYDDRGKRWLKTGDEGWLDKDGFLFFRERIKNVFKIAGHNVFPSDIEGLASKDERLMALAAVCVPAPRHPYVHLFIQVKPGFPEGEVIADLRKVLSGTLIRYSVPEKITAVSSMPRTKVGKIDRKALLERPDI